MIVFDPTKSIVNTNIFFACTQSTVTTGAGLSTTVSTISLSNDITSKKNLVLLNAQWSFSAAPANDAVVALVGNFNPSTNVTHTTPLLVQSAYINTVGGTGVGTRAVGKADTAATLPTEPVYYMTLLGTAAAALGPTAPFTDISGIFVIPPGGYVAIQSTFAATGLCSLMWAEYPVSI
jgi:hypothetical protein